MCQMGQFLSVLMEVGLLDGENNRVYRQDSCQKSSNEHFQGEPFLGCYNVKEFEDSNMGSLFTISKMNGTLHLTIATSSAFQLYSYLYLSLFVKEFLIITAAES